ncbi:MAG: sugar ABC transporter ATP-binding protein [Anaerolineae bacterium]|nr:sugar ABC transporter ATP-binding protein [Anaerolineae bacterium]NUQ04432.1 sugar ABC transporter ATP-binding protein [Anaerolineae bacterium]
MTAILEMRSISKAFPGVQALSEVTLTVERGQIHGLLGENGAGKSTLMKILAGVYAPDSGEILFDGVPVSIAAPHQAQQMGIVTIYQEFTLVPHLTIAENVFIGREPGVGAFMSWGRLRDQTRTVMEGLGIALDPMTPVSALSVAEQQMVEIARALSMQSKVIVMDEPTSALSEHEVHQLIGICRDLKAKGISIIFITHHLEEVMRVCDHITVLRDGRNAGSAPISDVKLDTIIQMMVGRSASELFKRTQSYAAAETVLNVRDLRTAADPNNPNKTALHGISFEVRRGEILGIAGLIGAGRTEAARAIFGADRFEHGAITFEGKPADIRSPLDAIRLGIGLIPEDRKQQALFLALAVRENLSIAALGRLLRWFNFVRFDAERQMVERYRQALNIRMSGQDQTVSNLSGGNQQKVVIARWLAMEPKLLIVDEPTRGIDVAAKAEVHQLLDELASRGIAIVMISSELPEILSMSDRILTIREGRLTGEFQRAEATEERLMEAMALSGASAKP